MAALRTGRPVRAAAPAPGRVTKVLAVGGLIALPVMVALAQVPVLSQPDYSLMRDTVSHLSTPGAAYAWFVNAAFIIQGTLVGAFGVAFARLLGGTPGRIAAALFVIYAATNVGAGIFQNDDYTPVVGAISENVLHDRLAQTGAIAISLSMLLLSLATRGDGRFPAVAGVGFAAIIVNVLLAPTIAFEWLQGYHGLFERLMFLGTLGWVALVSYRVLRMPAPEDT